MRHVKRVPPALLMVLLVLAGLASVLYGVYLLFGTPTTLIVGGCASVAVGLLADV